MKILQISDIHINFLAKRNLSKLNNNYPSLHEERCNRLISTVTNILYNFHDIDAIVISGDLFDKRIPLPEDYNIIKTFINYINNNFNILVYILSGNHDDFTNVRLSPLSILQQDFLARNGFYGLAVTEPQLLIIKNFPILLSPWNTPYERIMPYVSAVQDGHGMIFMHVGVIDGQTHWTQNEGESATIELEKLIALQCPIGIGHYHGQNELAKNIWYCGSLECFNFGEENQVKGCLLWNIEKEGCTVTPIQSSYIQYKTYDYVDFLKLSVNNTEDINKIIRIKGDISLEDFAIIIKHGNDYSHCCLGIQYNLNIKNKAAAITFLSDKLSPIIMLEKLCKEDKNLNEKYINYVLEKHNIIEKEIINL